MIANVDQGLKFQNFIEMTQSHAITSGDTLLKLERGNTGNLSIKFKTLVEDKIDGGFFSSRSNAQKTVNNTIRDAFLKSVLDRVGVSNASQLPEEIKSAMSLKEYRGAFGWQSRMTGAAGSSTTGKPLALRTIRAVVNAVQNWEVSSGKKMLEDFIEGNQELFGEQQKEALNVCGTLCKSVSSYFNKIDLSGNSNLKSIGNVLGDLSSKMKCTNKLNNEEVSGLVQKTALRTAFSLVPDLKKYIKRNLNNIQTFVDAKKLAQTGLGQKIGEQRCIELSKVAKALLEAYEFNDLVALSNAIGKMSKEDGKDALSRLGGKTLAKLLEEMTELPKSYFSSIRQKVLDYITEGVLGDLKSNGWITKNVVKAAAVEYLLMKYPGMDGDELIAKKVAVGIYNLLEKGEKMAPNTNTEVLRNFRNISSALKGEEAQRNVYQENSVDSEDSEGYEVEEEPALLIKK